MDKHLDIGQIQIIQGTEEQTQDITRVMLTHPGHLTAHLTAHLTRHPIRHLTRLLTGHPIRHPTRHPTRHLTVQIQRN